ncbi:MAG: GAF domain-containing sensor histidine kinase [Dehalococcoidales bacterium]|nr:GAF domain-containing sensor histidine kinase [Dehalococcoidales bacterium]
MRKTSVENAEAKVPYGELEQKTRELAAFLAVSEVLAGVPDLADLDEALGRALDKTLEIMCQDFGGIMLLDEKTNKLVLRVFRGFRSQHVASLCPKVGEGFAGKVVQTGQSQMTEDMLADPRVLRPDFAKRDKLRAFISVPLSTEGKVFGALNIASRRRRGFSIEEVRLLEGIGRQIAAAIENVRLHQKVREDKVRQELLHETFAIQEEERRRIARELHDETSQVLASLSANLEVAARMLPEDTDEVKSIIKKSQILSTSILERTHKLIYQLRPTLLDDLGLVAATRWLVESSLGDVGVKVAFKLKGRERRLPAKVETELFRVVQEIVANITRHASADNVAVVLFFHPGRITVRISDNGCGFDVNEAVTSTKRPRGLGLLGMRERIELINGTIRIDTHPGGGGTTIDIDIPIKGEADGKD